MGTILIEAAEKIKNDFMTCTSFTLSLILARSLACQTRSMTNLHTAAVEDKIKSRMENVGQ